MKDRANLWEDSRGAIMVIALFMAVMLVGFLYYLVGVGDAIVYRERMQDAADAGAFSSAVVHARGMNIIALINMIMAAALAVLVALKVVETLIIAGIVVAGALSFVTFGASLAAIPPLKTAQQGVKSAHDALREPVFTILRVGHETGGIVRRAMPVAAQYRAFQIVRSPEYSEPADFGFGWPIYAELPTTDGSYGVLCERAGKNVGDIAAYPFRKLGLGRVGRWISSGTESLAGKYSRWFCSGEGDPPTISTADLDDNGAPVPELAISRQCRQCGENEGTCSPEESERICDQAADVEKNAFPDENGRCKVGPEGDGCRERAERARAECRVGKDTNWVVQELDIERSFWRDPETGEIRHRDREVRSRRVTLDRSDPCGWDISGPKPIDPDQGDDLCGRDLPPEHPGPGFVVPTGEENAITRPYRYRPMLFGCSREMDARTFQGGAATRPGDTSNKVPQRMIDDVLLGDDRFQIRYVVHGERISGQAAKNVEFATWRWARGGGRRPAVATTRATRATTGSGSAATGRRSWQDLMHYLGQFSVAQAEYYWNGDPSADREEWVWSMQWRARMRRFRMPSDDSSAASGQCGRATGSRGPSRRGGRCAEISGMLGWLNGVVAH